MFNTFKKVMHSQREIYEARSEFSRTVKEEDLCSEQGLEDIQQQIEIDKPDYLQPNIIFEMDSVAEKDWAPKNIPQENMQELKERQSPLDASLWRQSVYEYKEEFEEKQRWVKRQLENPEGPRPKKKVRFNVPEEKEMELKTVLTYQNEMTEDSFGDLQDITTDCQSLVPGTQQHPFSLLGAGRNPKTYKMGSYIDINKLEGGGKKKKKKINPEAEDFLWPMTQEEARLGLNQGQRAAERRIREARKAAKLAKQQSQFQLPQVTTDFQRIQHQLSPLAPGIEVQFETEEQEERPPEPSHPVPPSHKHKLSTPKINPSPFPTAPTSAQLAIQTQLHQVPIPSFKEVKEIAEELESQPEIVAQPVKTPVQRKLVESPKKIPQNVYVPPASINPPPPPPPPPLLSIAEREHQMEDENNGDIFEEEYTPPPEEKEAVLETNKMLEQAARKAIEMRAQQEAQILGPEIEELVPLEAVDLPYVEGKVSDHQDYDFLPFDRRNNQAEIDQDLQDINDTFLEIRDDLRSLVADTQERSDEGDRQWMKDFVTISNKYIKWLDHDVLRIMEQRHKTYLILAERFEKLIKNNNPGKDWDHWIKQARRYFNKYREHIHTIPRSGNERKVAKDAFQKIHDWEKYIFHKYIHQRKSDAPLVEERKIKQQRIQAIGKPEALSWHEKKLQANARWNGVIQVKSGVLRELKGKHQNDALRNQAALCTRIIEKQQRAGWLKKVLQETLFTFRGFRLDVAENPVESVQAILGEKYINQAGQEIYKYQDLIQSIMIRWPAEMKWQITFNLYIQDYHNPAMVFPIVQKTFITDSYEAAYDEIIRKMEQIANNYDYDLVTVNNFQIGVHTIRMITDEEREHGLKGVGPDEIATTLFGGHMNDLLNARKEFKEDWFIINPKTKYNCLYVAYGICARWNEFMILVNGAVQRLDKFEKDMDALLLNEKVHSTMTKHIPIKKTFKKYAIEQDINNLAAKHNGKIIIWDEGNNILKETGGTVLTKKEEDALKKIKNNPDKGFIKKAKFRPINLLLSNHHFYALIPKSEVPPRSTERLLDEEKEQNKKKKKKGRYSKNQKDYEPITSYDKPKDLNKVIVYDLESYQGKKEKEKKDTEDEEDDIKEEDTNEITQICYAVGWCFEIETETENEWALQAQEEGLIEIEEFDTGSKFIKVAYRYLLGEDCLKRALEEWTSDKIYDDAMFYAHNGGKYDLRLILGQSDLSTNERYLISPERTVELNGRFINMTIHKIKKEDDVDSQEVGIDQITQTINFRDSLPLFGLKNPLHKLCEDFKVVHKKMVEKVGVHATMFKETWLENWNNFELAKYLKNDCIGLLEVLLQFEEQCFKATTIHITEVLTGASLAKKYYLRQQYQPESKLLSIMKLKKEDDLFIRESFTGGRVENFISKEIREKVYYYDFTSLYPDCACLDLPVGPPFYVSNRVEQIFQERIYHKCKGFKRKAFWKVKVYTLNGDNLSIDEKLQLDQTLAERKPLFGVKNKYTQNMLLFPWLQYDTPEDYTEMTLYEAEIDLAVELKLPYKFIPIEGILFEGRPVLKEAMLELFKMKSVKDKPALTELWKIVLNSLYGCWGIRKYDKDGLEIATSYLSNWVMDYMNNKLIGINNYGRYIVTRKRLDLPVEKCNVAISAAISSESRLKLYRCMWDIQNKGGRVLYCDTDSIITDLCLEDDQELSDKWLGPTKGKALGSLKNEIDKLQDNYLKDHPEVKEEDIMDISPLTGELRRKRYFDHSVIAAPKMYIVTAENGQIVKKANKGYKEKEGDEMTFEKFKRMVDPEIDNIDRVIEQDTNQWKGSNADFMKLNEEIGVTIKKIHKRIRAQINKGVLDPITREVRPFRNLEEVKEDILLKQEIRKEITKALKQQEDESDKLDRELNGILALINLEEKQAPPQFENMMGHRESTPGSSPPPDVEMFDFEQPDFEFRNSQKHDL